MKTIKKIATITMLSSIIFASNANAEKCVNLDNVNVKWTSYKTLEKIGVSGIFHSVKLNTKKNSSSIKEALKNTNVVLNMENIDAIAKIKTDNILKYFIPNLIKKNVKATIIAVYENSLELEITLNSIKRIIPMKYNVTNTNINSSGVIDALDFDLGTALKILNTNVAGHLNKGWNDIDISFSLEHSTVCK